MNNAVTIVFGQRLNLVRFQVIQCANSGFRREGDGIGVLVVYYTAPHYAA